jgi:hypothetical protein
VKCCSLDRDVRDLSLYTGSGGLIGWRIIRVTMQGALGLQYLTHLSLQSTSTLVEHLCRMNRAVKTMLTQDPETDCARYCNRGGIEKVRDKITPRRS